MKNIKHSILALSMVALLSACGGAKELSYADAKERTTHYSQKAAEEQYSATKMTTTVEVAEATGVFAKDGILSDMIPEAGTSTETINEVAIVTDFPTEEEAKEDNVKFFANGQYGIKVTAWSAVAEEKMPQLKGKFEIEYAFNDLGLTEYSNSLISMTIELDIGGIKAEGTAKYSSKITFEYIPAKNA